MLWCGGYPIKLLKPKLAVPAQVSLSLSLSSSVYLSRLVGGHSGEQPSLERASKFLKALAYY